MQDTGTTEKWLRVTMPNGEMWEVPARVIAHDRASYYANGLPEGQRTAEYEAEFAFTMEDDYELQDWAAGNMDWSDVVEHARKVEAPAADVDYQEGWVNGDKQIVVHAVDEEAPDGE